MGALSSLLSSNVVGHYPVYYQLTSHSNFHTMRSYTQHTAARSATLIAPSRGRITRRRCHSPSALFTPSQTTRREEGDCRPGYTPLHAFPNIRTQQCTDKVLSRDKINPRSTHFVSGSGPGVRGQSTEPHSSAFALTPAPTRSQASGLWRVRAHHNDSSSSSAVISRVRSPYIGGEYPGREARQVATIRITGNHTGLPRRAPHPLSLIHI